ncbi:MULTISPECIES: molecular chaperone [unclassified Pseudomonas]|uniref:fimbrial biogenesis chaperone n=1 Tax=unclassified Pseudomonas TaxID=196821 RepID=UPI000BC42D14|nr:MULTISPECIES: molecular chaperone [unclassified Pseudomonas]PVZ12670.1 P pilus assembly chaperone PapD [Pseudomonas sp. URIL14HWK12:I12]PVZ23179.1 P pilus assembly chaperone PapD [Pseudomonas sp. URIL14HWK12:I10]PVZ32508.1 P pilus assembly chaperone PapD [Pseudomonas sp. URIL14HWK12:I11]SNZ13564.1 P pilus assembly protein, chaperone PapD [Pseudomonas sp. URIL14HWK12:I9]
MRNTLLLSLAWLALCYTSASNASVTVGATRLIYDGAQNEANLTVSNRADDAPYLVQSWVSSYASGSEAAVDDFIVTPPLFRLDPNKENILRVIFAGAADVPRDRESLFLMNVKAIPAISDAQRDKNVLQIALKTTIKLFYRPAGLKGSPKAAVAGLRWRAEGGRLYVDNPSAFHVVVSELKVNGQALKQQIEVLKPGEQRSLPANTKPGDQITLAYIDDYGTNVTAPVIRLP